MKVANTLVVLFLLLTSVFANDPTSIPWPVGSTAAMMNSTVNGTGGGVPVAAQGYVPLNQYF